MANIKTPIIKPFRTKGGTFCSFNSAIEDIGLNINEQSNKVRLSHYVVMDIPNCDYNDKTIHNKFNLLTPYDAFYKTINDEEYTGDVNSNIAQSFMSYALNMESVVRNQKDNYDSYDFTTHLSVSERVFWKWLKETGAIRWQRASVYTNGVENPDEKNYNYFIEEREGENYSRVIKGFGAIDAVAQRSSDYGMYNEIYVNIPSSFGQMKNVFFKQVEDNNYSFKKVYNANVNNFFNLEGYEDKGTLLDTGLKNIGYFDFSSTNDSSTNDSSFYFYLNGKKGDRWFSRPTQTNDFNAYYITDENVGNLIDVSLNDLIEIKKDDVLFYQIQRSKLDCMCIEFEPSNIAKILDKDEITYDELNIGDNIESNYNFNTILVYYSVYDDNDNILATNLYGVYFIDALKENNEYSYNPNFRNFEIPRLPKKQSSLDGFGTSYSFKLNIRTASLYDSNSDIYDNSSSENSIVSDFNDVVANLNIAVDLLSRHTKNSEILQHKYDEVYNLFLSINDKMTLLQQNYNREKKYEEELNNINSKLQNIEKDIEKLSNLKNNIVYYKQNI